jgi:hypothetical protein
LPTAVGTLKRKKRFATALLTLHAIVRLPQLLN